MSRRVKNRMTGLVHDVPAGHPALNDGLHDVLPEERAGETAETPETAEESTSRPRRRKARRKAADAD